MMTQEQLNEIKARVQMARPGPWVFREGTSVKGSIVGNGWHVDLIGDNYEAWASVDFIAHSRTDIPALIAEVERLRAAIISWIKEEEDWQAEVTRWQERARLYHNHLVILQEDCEALVLQRDTEAIIQ